MHTLSMVPLLTVVACYTLLLPCDSLVADLAGVLRLARSWVELDIRRRSYPQQGYVEEGMHLPSAYAWVWRH